MLLPIVDGIMDTMAPTPEDYRRAGERIRYERSLRWSDRRRFAEDIGLGSRTVGAVERGEIGTRTGWDTGTIAKIERAFGWAYGSYDALLRGGEPTPLEEQPPPLPSEITVRPRDILDNPNLTDEMRQEILGVLLEVGIPTTETDRGRKHGTAS